MMGNLRASKEASLRSSVRALVRSASCLSTTATSGSLRRRLSHFIRAERTSLCDSRVSVSRGRGAGGRRAQAQFGCRRPPALTGSPSASCSFSIVNRRFGLCARPRLARATARASCLKWSPARPFWFAQRSCVRFLVMIGLCLAVRSRHGQAVRHRHFGSGVLLCC